MWLRSLFAQRRIWLRECRRKMAGRWHRRVRLVAPMVAVCMTAALCTAAAPAAAAAAFSGPHQVSLLTSAPLKRPLPEIPGGGSGGDVLRHGLPRPVGEIVADRTGTSSTWRNADGTLSVRRYLAPHFYRSGASGWQPISSRLTAVS